MRTSRRAMKDLKNENYLRFGTTDVLMFLTVLVWGFNLTVIKISLRDFSPHGFNGIRLISASLILIAAALIRKERLSVDRKDIPRILILSLLGQTIYQFLFIKGISLTTASNTSLIMASSPILIALLSSFAGQERIHWAGWFGIFISFLGIYLVVAQKPESFTISPENIKGDLMILTGNLCWAAYTILLKPLLDKYSPLAMAAISLPIGTFFYLFISAPAMMRLNWAGISLVAWGGLAFSAVLAIGICFIIWNLSVKRMGNTKTGIYSNVTPLVAVAAAHFFLGENITIAQAAGAVVIFLGFYLARSGYLLFARWKHGKAEKKEKAGLVEEAALAEESARARSCRRAKTSPNAR